MIHFYIRNVNRYIERLFINISGHHLERTQIQRPAAMDYITPR